MDQTIEETSNKGTRTPGGTKGFSTKKGAVSRYYILQLSIELLELDNSDTW